MPLRVLYFFFLAGFARTKKKRTHLDGQMVNICFLFCFLRLEIVYLRYFELLSYGCLCFGFVKCVELLSLIPLLNLHMTISIFLPLCCCFFLFFHLISQSTFFLSFFIYYIRFSQLLHSCLIAAFANFSFKGLSPVFFTVHLIFLSLTLSFLILLSLYLSLFVS